MSSKIAKSFHFAREVREIYVFCVNLVGGSIELKKHTNLVGQTKTYLQSRCGPQATLQSLEQSLAHFL